MSYLDLDVIKNTRIFRNITDCEFYGICSAVSFAIKSYEKGESIIQQGDEVRKIGIILEGRVTGAKYHYDGSMQILKLLEPLDIIGLEAVTSSFLTSPCRLVADEDCSIIFFAYKDILECEALTEECRQRLLQNVINILSDENIRMMYKVDVLSKRTLRERIIAHLSIISEKRASWSIDIGMTQEQFAQYLCVSRSALSKELNDMRRDGIIDFSGSVYTIKDYGPFMEFRANK